VLAGAFRGPANIAGERKYAELASGVFAVVVGEGVATVVCVHWVVAVANEVKDVFRVGVLGVVIPMVMAGMNGTIGGSLVNKKVSQPVV